MNNLFKNNPTWRLSSLLLSLTGLLILVWFLPFFRAMQGMQIMSLPEHIFVETFSIVVSAMIFGVAWNAYSKERPGSVMLIACVSLAVALLDFAHILSYAGMPDFVTPSSAEKAINFWIAARFIFALAVLYGSFRPRQPLTTPSGKYWLLAGSLGITGLIYYLNLFHQESLPHTFIKGTGLTPFKIGAEYTIIAMLLVATLNIYRTRKDFRLYDTPSLFAALYLTILSELCFTIYSDVSDIFNLLGHIYKVIAYAFIYKAVFVACVQQPFRKLQQANSEIRQAETRYSLLTELSPVGIFQTDGLGNYLYVNDGWSEIVGLSNKEARQKSWTEGVHPDDRDRIISLWQKTSTEKKPFQTEFRFQRPDGTSTWVYGQARAALANDGTVKGYIGSITDINDRKKMEETLRYERDNFTNILETMGDGVYIVDDHYDIKYANKVLSRMFGDYQGRKCYEYVHDRQEICPWCPNQKVFAGETIHWDCYYEKIDRHYDLVDTPLKNADGSIAKLEIMRDVTNRRRNQEKLRKAKEEWERTFDAIPDAITIQDETFHIRLANRAATDLAGLSREEIIGKQCHTIYCKKDQTCADCLVAKTLRDQQSHTIERYYEDWEKTFLISTAPIFDNEGACTSVVHTAKDITKTIELTSQLRQAQKMEAIGNLAGGIAHDFNNLLTAIIGYSELVQGDLDKNTRAYENLRQVFNAGNRAKDLVKQILTFSRLSDRGHEPIMMHLVVKEALKLLRSSIPTSIEISSHINSRCKTIMADPTQIHQIMMNLCTNAYQAMRETGGILTVSLEEVELDKKFVAHILHLTPGTYLHLQVSDTGYGMPPEVLEQIFEPYFTTKAKGEGTGLGLSVVHGIVNSHGGHIKAESEPGVGTTFHIYLPCVELTAQAITNESTAVIPRGSARILVVDDEKSVMHLETTLLMRLGYEVVGLIDSEEALALFQKEPRDFDLVITDMTMPRLTGAELAQKMIATRPDIPIILCTGFSELIDSDKANALGIREFLIKPITSAQLAEIIDRILTKPSDIVPETS